MQSEKEHFQLVEPNQPSQEKDLKKKAPSINSEIRGPRKQKSGRLGARNIPRKPWENHDGSLLTDEQLSEVSKSWDYQTWEAYLSSLETLQSEYLLDEPERVSDVLDIDYAEAVYATLKDDKYPDLSKSIRIHLNKLSERERQVLEMYFWESRNIADIARNLGVGRDAVRSYMDRGIKKIRTLLTTGRIRKSAQVLKLLRGGM